MDSVRYIVYVCVCVCECSRARDKCVFFLGKTRKKREKEKNLAISINQEKTVRQLRRRRRWFINSSAAVQIGPRVSLKIYVAIIYQRAPFTTRRFPIQIDLRTSAAP